MLQNACLLAKIGADTAENERNFAEILPNIGNYPTVVAMGNQGSVTNLVGSAVPVVAAAHPLSAQGGMASCNHTHHSNRETSMR